MKPKKPVNPQKLSPGQKLVERADFDRALRSASRVAVHAEVTLLNRRKVKYSPRDFGRIPFPVLDAVLQFEQGSGEFVYVGNGEGYTKDRTKIRTKR